MKPTKLRRPTVQQSIWLIVAVAFFLLVFAALKPSAILLPVYRLIYMPKTQTAFNEAQNQLGPILSFVDAGPLLKRPLYCDYTAPPRVLHRHLACTYYISGEHIVAADAAQLQMLNARSLEATGLLRTHGWTATAPASRYGGDWHATSLDKAQILLSQTDSWVKYVRSFGDIECVLTVEVRPEHRISENGRQVKVDLSCGHVQNLPAPTLNLT
jgi:hypothetical protein